MKKTQTINRLVEWREQNNMDQIRLAELTGYDSSHISNFEKGRLVSLRVILAIEKATGLSFEENKKETKKYKSEQKIKKAREMYISGEASPKEIANIIGVTPETIYIWCRGLKRGKELKKKKPTNYKPVPYQNKYTLKREITLVIKALERILSANISKECRVIAINNSIKKYKLQLQSLNSQGAI